MPLFRLTWTVSEIDCSTLKSRSRFFIVKWWPCKLFVCGSRDRVRSGCGTVSDWLRLVRWLFNTNAFAIYFMNFVLKYMQDDILKTEVVQRDRQNRRHNIYHRLLKRLLLRGKIFFYLPKCLFLKRHLNFCYVFRMWSLVFFSLSTFSFLGVLVGTIKCDVIFVNVH